MTPIPTPRISFLACVVLLCVAGCGATLGRGLYAEPGGDGGSEAIDLAIPPLGEDGSTINPNPTHCDANTPCAAGNVCFNGTCITNNGTCMSDNDCENDTYCDCQGGGGGDAGACVMGLCIPWGTGPRGTFDPTCQTSGFSASAFKPPVEKCHWTPTQGESADIIMTPVVADLDLDGKPEIIFSNYVSNSTQGLVAIHGADCSPYFEFPNLALLGFSQIAVADLDNDKKPEIIAIDSNQLVTIFDNTGKQLAKSPTPYITNNQGSDCTGPAIADVDNDGIPEILVSGEVLRYVKGQAQLTVLWNKSATIANGVVAHWGTLSVLADLDGDGRPEAITGLKVYDGATGADKTPTAFASLGATGAYPQVADFNGDKKPDILLVQSQQGQQQVSIVDVANDKIIFGPYLVKTGWGGPAIIADFDGDKIPDFGLSSTSHYYVYSLKCGAANPPADCKGPDPGVLWERNTYDESSGGTASSVFDFNGDGTAEVVYRDECWMRVMNGPDGKTVFAQMITSGTCLEMPVVADVDNDGHADLIVPSDNVQGNNHCQAVPEGQTGQVFSASTQGLFVLRDPMNRWLPSRGIWNEHTYHITNILDDCSVPKVETPNWSQFNNFRQNVQGLTSNPMAIGDLTGGAYTGIDSGDSDCVTKWTLSANMCNRGTAAVPAGVPGTFYSSDPRLANPMKICTGTSGQALAPGQCTTIQCDWINPPDGSVELWFRADDDGTGKAPQSECKSNNDLLIIPSAACNKIG